MTNDRPILPESGCLSESCCEPTPGSPAEKAMAIPPDVASDSLSDYLLGEAEELRRLDARWCPSCGYLGDSCHCGERGL